MRVIKEVKVERCSMCPYVIRKPYQPPFPYFGDMMNPEKWYCGNPDTPELNCSECGRKEKRRKIGDISSMMVGTDIPEWCPLDTEE